MSDVDSFLAGRDPSSRAFYVVVRNIIATFCRVFWRSRVIDGHNVPRTGAYVLAPVHRSNIDTLLACTVTRRRLRYMGKDSLWTNRIAGWILSALGGFPVSRGTADREAFKRGIAVLQSGEPLVLFPEGERKSGPVVHPLFDGAVYMAVKAGVPIVPVGIGGSERAMRKGSKMIKPTKCVLLVGSPISVPPHESGRASRSAVKDVSQSLHSELQRLFDRAQTLAD
jgi:1-acyl-sn-glycerol-3-phosphate acyltransferase